MHIFEQSNQISSHNHTQTFLFLSETQHITEAEDSLSLCLEVTAVVTVYLDLVY